MSIKIPVFAMASVPSSLTPRLYLTSTIAHANAIVDGNLMHSVLYNSAKNCLTLHVLSTCRGLEGTSIDMQHIFVYRALAHIDIHAYSHIWRHVCIDVVLHACKHVHMHAFIHSHSHASVHTGIHACID